MSKNRTCAQCGMALVTRAEHDRRVVELLTANNIEVERRRSAEAELNRLRKILGEPAPRSGFGAEVISKLRNGPRTAADLRRQLITENPNWPRRSVGNALDHLRRTGQIILDDDRCYSLPETANV